MADREGESTSGEVDRGPIEAEAKRMGWAPKEQWRGDPELWKDADEYVRRGKEIIPIVRAQNQKLTDQLAEATRQLAELKGTLTKQEQTTKDLLKHQAEQIERQVKEKLADLKKEKREAIREGNHDLAADLEEEIDQARDDLAAAAKAPAPATAGSPPAAPAPQYEPWALEFGQANDEWLGKDKRKTALFMGIAEDLMATTSLRAGALLEEAKVQAEAILNKAPAQRMAKSEGGGGGWEGTGQGGGSSGGAKTFAALPQEAKEACRAQAKKFVGESGKAFKTEAEWQKHYAETYFASQR